ncbi:MAG: tetratricopeptide repeat protein [Candidatus Dadabacteria bacterium]|nr:tetratricopeptide repeat protein [Candidatus Dadabacteria bacterium]NIV41180.1 tetratricopeptide repeat protein [Candidatus Dadabacteria bacterium]NIX14469.1 tetratricopeptide repeat protein [Candidatus Dadabacteria bacterium]
MKNSKTISAVLLTVLIITISSCKNNGFENTKRSTDSDPKTLLLKKRIAKDKQNFTDRNRLAHHYIQKSRVEGNLIYIDRAEDLLNESLENNPQDYDANIYMGLVRLSKHRFTEALEYGNKALSIKPGSAHALGVIGDAYKEIGEIKKAEQAYNKMAEIAPGLDSYSRIANLKAESGNLPEAIKLMEKAYELGVSHGSAKENLAWTQVMIGSHNFDSGNFDTAEEHYINGLDILEDYYLALEHLAEVNAAKGNNLRALALYDRVVKIAPKPEFYLARADVQKKLGFTEDAKMSRLAAEKLVMNEM